MVKAALRSPTWIANTRSGFAACTTPPPALFIAGQGGPASLAALAAVPVVGVVGTRKPSPYGGEMAAAIGADLAKAGVVVVSGLAMGIDAIAQEAALGSAGAHMVATVGVLGCGADVVYPRCNDHLFAAVRRRGLLVSEFVWGLPARGWRFPARNRVIAGLCDALVVVEGSENSGALITADFMTELNGNVLAVPGEAGRRLSAGPHKLLRTCAALCESAADVLAELGLAAPAVPPPAGPWADGRELPAGVALLLAALDAGELGANELAAAAGESAAAASSLLAWLEVEGLVRPCPGGRFRLIRGRTPESA